MRWLVVVTVGLLAVLRLGVDLSFAADNGGSDAVERAQQAQKAEQPQGQTPQPQLVMPNAEQVVLLLRNTLITLNDALQTGNFTVLRDRGAPGFRSANSAARLSQIFSGLVSKGLDFSIVSILTPQLTEPPKLDREKRMLLLQGYFPGPSFRIKFEILYREVGGYWRLFGLAVNTSGTQPSAARK